MRKKEESTSTVPMTVSVAVLKDVTDSFRKKVQIWLQKSALIFFGRDLDRFFLSSMKVHPTILLSKFLGPDSDCIDFPQGIRYILEHYCISEVLC